MACVPGSRENNQPPTLPVKQHRRSSVESDSVFSSAGLQHHSFGPSDVFSEPTDCHAAQCPIHQRYDPFKHQMRFFSDGTPPPVPKKRLTRTLSLPGIDPPAPSSLSPLSPLQRRPQNFDNPLYMMAPISDTFIYEETEDIKPARSPAPFPPLSKLSFDTPDERLASLFGNFEDKHVVFERIQHGQLLCLRSIAQRVEDWCLFQVKERDPSSYGPQDFLLCDGGKPKTIGEKTYFSLQSPRFPGRVLGLRVCKGTKGAPWAPNKEQLHANVLDIIAYYQPGISQVSNPATTLDPLLCGARLQGSQPPDGRSTVDSLLQEGHCVSVERDLPHATLEDFVRDSGSVQGGELQDYDRQACVLLLQVLMGSHHLYSTRATAADLRPREILLVWPSKDRRKGEDAPGGHAQRGWLQELWRRYGSPRVLVAPQSAASLAPLPLASIQCQMGALIQFCLRQQEPPKIHLRLCSEGASSCVLSASEWGRPQMTDIIAMLPVLLWGPRFSDLSHRGPASLTAVQNWLAVKRALLLVKLAEVGLIQDQPGLDWEDCMCLKYLPFTDSETVAGVAAQLCNILS